MSGVQAGRVPTGSAGFVTLVGAEVSSDAQARAGIRFAARPASHVNTMLFLSVTAIPSLLPRELRAAPRRGSPEPRGDFAPAGPWRPRRAGTARRRSRDRSPVARRACAFLA